MSMQSKRWRTLYWVVTLLFLGGQVWSASAYDVIAAFVSHLRVGDPLVVARVPLAVLLLQAVSTTCGSELA